MKRVRFKEEQIIGVMREQEARTDRDGPADSQLLAIAERRRLHVLLRRDGEAASRNKVYRLYRAEGLAVRKEGGYAISRISAIASAISPDDAVLRAKLARAPSCEARLGGQRKRKARRRVVGQRVPLLPALLANARWSLDFVHDQLAC